MDSALTHLKLRHLTCALEIVQAGSLRRAAEVLCVTESAVSKTLRELESELGVRLFDRSKRGMTLTDKGRQFMRHASSALDALQSGVESARRPEADGAAILRIGAMSVVAVTLLPEVVRCFLRDHPHGTIDIARGLGATLLSRLRDGLVEMVLGRMPSPADMTGLSFETLYGDPYGFFVRTGHPLLALRRFSAARMAGYPLILPPRPTETWSEIQGFLAASKLVSGPRVEILEVPFSRDFTLHSDAIWIGSERAAAADLRLGHLRALPLRKLSEGARVGIITRHTEMRMPHQRMMIDLVHEATRHYLEKAAV